MAELAALKAPLAGDRAQQGFAEESGKYTEGAPEGVNVEGAERVAWYRRLRGEHQPSGLDRDPESIEDCVYMVMFDLHLLLGAYVNNDGHKGQLEAWALYNPLYWAVFAVLAVYTILGFAYHVTQGQGGKVREDETKVEKAVRLQWCYLTGGILQLSQKVAIVEIVTGFVLTERKYILEGIYTCVVTFCIMMGNVYGYRAMEARNHHDIGIFIVTTACFILALLVVLLEEIVNDVTREEITSFAVWSICSRSFVIIMGFKMTGPYCSLWHMYPGPSSNSASTSTNSTASDPPKPATISTATTTSTAATSSSTRPKPPQRNTWHLLLIVIVMIGITLTYGLLYWLSD